MSRVFFSVNPQPSLTFPLFKQLIVLTTTHLEVYDIRSSSLVERIAMTASSLTSLQPASNETDLRVSHSLRVYKGKLFVLVCLQILLLSIRER